MASRLDLLLALALAACGDAGGGDDTSTADTTAATATTGAASTGDAPTSSSSSPSTGPDDPDTGTTSGADTSGGSTGPGFDCAASPLTWDNFGAGFALTWCTGCHHSALPKAERACAPCGVNFDTHAGFYPLAGLIQIRVIDHAEFMVPPMPPAATIPDDELALLAEWIACGAPGPDVGVQGPACPDPDAVFTCPNP